MGKNLSNKYSQKLLNRAKKFTTDTIKTASKRAIQKTEATGDLIGSKIADKIKSVSKSLTHSKNDDENNEIEVSKKKYTSPEQQQQIIDELRLA